MGLPLPFLATAIRYGTQAGFVRQPHAQTDIAAGGPKQRRQHPQCWCEDINILAVKFHRSVWHYHCRAPAGTSHEGELHAHFE
jgi:hypothetical protein